MLLRHIITIIILLAALPLQAQELDFLRTDINYIEMNGDNWEALQEKISNLTSNDSKFNILHIGDSHIQADYMTDVTRRLLQQQFGNGGRGCIAALKLAGTNQPDNYTLTADEEPAMKCRLAKPRTDIRPGITGIGVSFRNPSRNLTITLHGDDSLFSSVTLLHAPSSRYDTAYVGNHAIAGVKLTDYATSYDLADEVQSATLHVNIDGALYGAYLTNNSPGIIYNAIGNNGACFSDYLKIDGFAKQSQFFHSDLIILSFGTNEAFGKSSDSEIYSNIDRLVKALRASNPDAKFLLTTPMECQRRLKRSRFAVNRRVAGVREVIKSYGRKNHIPVWDLYAIAGGEGASRHWIECELLSSRDRVHCRVAGYEVQGSMLADALLLQLQPDYLSHSPQE